MTKKDANAKKPKPEKAKDKEAQPKVKTVFTVGKRKRAVARASFRKGSGRIIINSRPLELVQPEMIRLKIREPLAIAGDSWKQFDVRINVRGGGAYGQAEAARQSLARGLVQLLGGDLKQRYLSYDRNLLVYDPRRTEPHKPPHSSWGPRRYKQRSKR
jgi:small subunit ribosomal protein S9